MDSVIISQPHYR